MAGDSFSSMFDDEFAPRPRPTVKKQEKGVVWEAKKIDGKYYVRLDQVYDLLKANNVLPKVQEGLKRRLGLK